MRNNTQTNILTMLKAEVGDKIAGSTARDTELNQKLADAQTWLSCERDWPFLESRWDLGIAGTTRYYDFPTNSTRGVNLGINTERPFYAQYKWNSIWSDVDYGIEAEEFNYLDSDVGTTQDPVERWRFMDDTSGTKIEVWPLPASSGNMRFLGQRKLQSFANPTDKADLDDLLIVLFTTANLLAGKPAGQNALVAANQRLNRLLGAYPNRTRRYTLGGAHMQSDRKEHRNVPIVVIHG